MVQTLRSLLGRAGITVPTVTFHDLPAALQAEYAGGVDVDDTGTCSAVSSLLRNALPGHRLNVFLVRSLTSSVAAGEVVGVDGTIPGPSTFGGTGASGAAVSTQNLRWGRSSCTGGGFRIGCGADETAYVLAHEAGHFLGLYHVTEAGGTAFDPLRDTPMCPCDTCKPASATATCGRGAGASPYALSVADCSRGAACGGGDNLMFWVLDRDSAGLLTAEQQQVMRANPLIR
jgi:hypothetical protein